MTVTLLAALCCYDDRGTSEEDKPGPSGTLLIFSLLCLDFAAAMLARSYRSSSWVETLLMGFVGFSVLIVWLAFALCGARQLGSVAG